MFKMRITFWKSTLFGLLLSIGLVSLFGLLESAADHPKSSKGIHWRLTHPDVAGLHLEEALSRDFLTQQEWATVLSVVPRDELLRVVAARSPDFWQSSPIGESAAYHIFGAWARFDSAEAIEQAIQAFAGTPEQNGTDSTASPVIGVKTSAMEASAQSSDEPSNATPTPLADEKQKAPIPPAQKRLDRSSGISCLRWAVLGIFENAKGMPIEGCFTKCPQAYWPALIQGAIGGSDTGTVAQDVQSYQALLSRLLPDSNADPKINAKAKLAKAQVESLLHSVLDAWIKRDPIAVMAWLQTKDGAPYNNLLQRAMAIAGLGGADAMARLMSNSSLPFQPGDFATACYRNGWNAAAIRTLAAKLPSTATQEFLMAYAKQLANGSPRTLADFVDAADPSLLIPSVANVLGPGIMKTSPHLFEKLAAGMVPAERDGLLDGSYDKMRGALSPEADAIYLQLSGNAPDQRERAEIAVGDMARSDLPRALAFIASEPTEKRQSLLEAAYGNRVTKLVETGKSLDDVFREISSFPPEVLREASTNLLYAFARKDSSQCLKALGTYIPADLEMCSQIFGSPELFNFEQKNNFLQQEIKKGIDPLVYMEIAQRMTSEVAGNDIGEAFATVAALPDQKVRDACTASVLAPWAFTDPFGAAGYVSALPAGEGRDLALDALLPLLSFAPDKVQELLSLASSEEVRAALRTKLAARKPRVFQ